MSEAQRFPVTERTRLKRSHKRAVTQKQKVFDILDAALECHVGYVMEGEPYVTPTCHVRVGERLYWHGSSASKMLRHLAEGLPVCVNVSILDGIVLARSGFHSSFNYRSVTAFGRARLVEEDEERVTALEAIVERITPGRWAEVRPMTDQELKATKLLSLDLEEVSCKIRDGGPIDDEEDYALPIWAGVIPIHHSLGQPEEDGRVQEAAPLPSGIGKIHYG